MRSGFQRAIRSALVLVLALLAYVGASYFTSTQPGDQGCINQGSDRRLAAALVCSA